MTEQRAACPTCGRGRVRGEEMADGTTRYLCPRCGSQGVRVGAGPVRWREGVDRLAASTYRRDGYAEVRKAGGTPLPGLDG
jgi:ribosomal protein S27AE